jgi:hypothetical protein
MQANAEEIMMFLANDILKQVIPNGWRFQVGRRGKGKGPI